MTARARSSITGRFVSWLFASRNPDTTVKETNRPILTKEEINYAISALEAQAGTKRNEKVRSAVLGKLVRMLG